MPRLVIRQGEGVGRDQHLGVGPCVVGRGPGVDFTLDDNAMSRQHFQVVGQAGIWVLEDLGSTNGTYLNGQRARRAALKDGDAIRAGGTELRFVQKDMLAGTPSALKAPVPRRRRR